MSITDDTDAINAAIAAANAAGGGDVVINGDVLVSAKNEIESAARPAAIVMKSNVRLIFQNDARMTLDANAFEGYQIIHCDDISNFAIINAHLIGDKDTHTASPPVGEWGHCIHLDGCTDFLLDHPTCTKGWGDGIYVGAGTQTYCLRGRIVDAVCDDNRRQGMSIISCEDLEVIGGRFTNTSGTAPQCGIDVEPNLSTERLKGLRIIDVCSEGNASTALLIYLAQFRSTTEPVDIVVRGLHSYQDLRGVTMERPGASGSHVRGRIVIDGLYVKESVRSGVRVASWDKDGPAGTINEPTIIDPATAGAAALATNETTGITLIRDSTVSDTFGGITVVRPTIVDGNSNIEYGIFAQDSVGPGPFERTRIVDPLRIEGATVAPYWNSDGLEIFDGFRASVRDADSNFTVNHTPHYPTIDNSTFTATRTITLGDDLDVGTVIVFELTGPQLLRVDPETQSPAVQILQLTTAAGKYVEGQQGSRLALRKIADLLWMPIHVTGTWTEEP